MYKKQKNVIIIVLLITIFSLSIGLAAFSQNLNINSSTQVKPNPDNFKVYISNGAKEKINSIKADHTSVTGVPFSTATDANITVENGNIIIDNINVFFIISSPNGILYFLYL